ncbi:MAG: S-layer homology domain-containing protein [Thermoleophilia bacterium]
MDRKRGIGGGVLVLAALALTLPVAPARAEAAPVVVSDPNVPAHLAALTAEYVLLEEELGGGPSEIVLYEIASGQRLRLTNNDYPDDRAFLDGHYVIWEGHVAGTDAEVFLYDRESRETRRLTDNEAEDVEPRLAGHLAAWGQRDAAGARVLLHDTDTGETRVLAMNLFDPSSIRIGEGWIVWQGVEDAATALFAHSLADGQTRRLSPSPNSGALAPSVSGTVVAWVELAAGGAYQVWALDLDTGSRAALGGSWEREPTVTVAGDSVLVAEDDPFDGRVALFERSGPGFGPEQRLSASPAGRAGEPGLAGGLAVWRASDYHDREIFLFDRERNLRRQLTNTPWNEQRPLTAEGRVAWEDYGSGFAQVLLAAPDVPTASPYGDVPLESPFLTAVTELSDRGVVHGYGTGAGREFRPDRELLRAQLAKIMVEALGLPVDETMTSGFTDLGPEDPASLYPHQYVAAATRAGLFVGKSPSLFAPYEPVSRGQVLSVVVRAAEQFRPGVLEEPPPSFWNLSAEYPSPHTKNIDRAKYNGLLGGILTGDSGWNPWEAFTRGQAVQVVWNLLGLRAPAGAAEVQFGTPRPEISSLAELEDYVANRQGLLEGLARTHPDLPVVAEVVLRRPLPFPEFVRLWETYAFSIDMVFIVSESGGFGTGARPGEGPAGVVERLQSYGENVVSGPAVSLQVRAPAGVLLSLAGEEAVFGVAPGPVEELLPLLRAGTEVYTAATSSLSSFYQKYAGLP